MSIAGILIGVLNCVLVAAILVLLGAIVAYVFSAFEWPIPWNIQRLYLLVVAIIFLICVISLLLGVPMVHLFGRADVGPPFRIALSSAACYAIGATGNL